MPNMWPNSAITLKRPFFALFGAFSQARMVEIENGFLRCDQHLELQVLSTHMPYFEELFFRPQIAPLGFFKLKSHRLNVFFYGKKMLYLL